MARRIIFSDQVAQYPDRYNLSDLGNETWQIIPNPGTVSTPGTPLSASNLNAIADEVIFKLKDTSTSTTAYTTDISALTTYYEGLTIMFKPANTNTGTSTINISGAGAVAIKKTDNSGNIVDLQANDLIKNKYSTMTYDGTEFLMNNPSADLAETIADITAIENRLDIDETSIASLKTETVKLAILTSSNNTYGASISTVASYTSGLNVDIIPNIANTGACTLNVNGLGAKNLTYNGSPLVSGFLQQNKIYRTIYNGVNFEIQPSSSFTPVNNGTVQTNLIAEQAAKLQTARNIALSGDATGNVDFKGDSNVTLPTILKDTGTAGTYRSVTTDAKGRVTAGTNPTTRDGYGLVDVYTKTESDTAISTGANNAVTGVTISDFTGKVTGSVVANPNIAKRTAGNDNQTRLLLPNEFVIEIGTNDAGIATIEKLDGSTLGTSTSISSAISQHLFEFDLISIVERKYGTIPGSTTADKVTWLKNNIASIICNWYGYGSCPSGNKNRMAYYGSSSWQEYSSSPFSYATPTLVKSILTPTVVIQPDGFIYLLAYTDASDGTTPSTIYTDYIDIQLTFKNIFSALMLGEASLDSHKAEIATQSQLGHVKQGTGISIDSNGALSVATGSALFKSASSTFTTRGTSQSFTDTFCTVNSLVTIAITSSTKPQGIWTVDSSNGSFTITSTVAETADITFDYYVQKAVA